MEQLKSLVNMLNKYAELYVEKHKDDQEVKVLGQELSIRCVRRMYYFYLKMADKYDDNQTYTEQELKDLAIDAVDYFYESNINPLKYFS